MDQYWDHGEPQPNMGVVNIIRYKLANPQYILSYKRTTLKYS